MTELLLPDEIVIPDGIEPLIKWKALRFSGSYLYSPSQEMVWPYRERAEATCKSMWDYGWEPVSHLPNIPTEEGYSYGPTFQTTSGSVMMYGSSYTQPQTVTQQMPRVELPDGLSWSWESKPHQVASETCGCGIYCVDTAEACLSYCREQCVICKIAVWGRVVPGTAGARAQYAYPQSIEFAMGLNNKELMTLARIYGLTLPEGEVIYIPKDAKDLSEGNKVFQVHTGSTNAMPWLDVAPVVWTPVEYTQLNTHNDFQVFSQDDGEGGLQVMFGIVLLLVYLLMGGVVVFGTPWFVKILAMFCMLLMTVLVPFAADKSDA